MLLKRIDPVSCGIVLAFFQTLIGLVAGGAFTLISLVGVQFAGNADIQPLPMVFSAAAIILVPLFYGVAGFVGGIVFASLYNLAAACVGGVRIEFEELPDTY